ncbi:MAG: C45 family peptidase [Bacteroidales bacterium]|nr:C45 family peptidase [Bacteroidales bacterium]MCF8458316.1 C45 family peptidase [Bacteroidales bacterium]
MPEKKKRTIWKILRSILLVLLAALVVFVIWFVIDTRISPPKPEDMSVVDVVRENPSDNFYTIGNNWLRKSESGLWELYVEGLPFELGVINGKLSKELIRKQEEAFVDQINELIPSSSYLQFLKYFIAWFNRDIDEHVSPEYLLEIYGVSLSASKEYEYIIDNYQRMLNYHAAHDIGHALQNLALVGCTSFSEWNDCDLIVGRNFDFYINDEFAENKLVAFFHPEKGYRFMSVTWASMIGVVSGMNEKGLTVTINAAKSEIPTSAATPISILAREILQYAQNIEEAIALANKRKTFVSESIMIGSAADNETIIIEKSPSKTEIVRSSTNRIVCTNHFQSEAFQDEESRLTNIDGSASIYRMKRCNQLIDTKSPIDVQDAADILRDRYGLNGEDIGIGNEKVMNQMISHHSVIFLPKKKTVWVSTPPYQLGKYVVYDLNKIFALTPGMKTDHEIYEDSLTIPADTFLTSVAFEDYEQYVDMRKQLKNCIKNNTKLADEKDFVTLFISLNPEYFVSYSTVANYYYDANEFEKASRYFKLALTKEINSSEAKKDLETKLEKSLHPATKANND